MDSIRQIYIKNKKKYFTYFHTWFRITLNFYKKSIREQTLSYIRKYELVLFIIFGLKEHNFKII